MNKKLLSESDICDRFISPSLVKAGWDENRWRREYPFTAGRIIVRGELNSVHIGRSRRIAQKHVHDFINSLEVAV